MDGSSNQQKNSVQLFFDELVNKVGQESLKYKKGACVVEKN